MPDRPCGCGRFLATWTHFWEPGLAWHCRGCMQIERNCSCERRPDSPQAETHGEPVVIWSGAMKRYLRDW